ncbi:MAG: PadR family transcriptional regulator [Proteobacteria bacterium]|nr:PadR family transcriptional regulator [Pseudomonadota bacterium]
MGTLDFLESASGYDIIRELDRKMISRWANVKKGSIYNALKTLSKGGHIRELTRVKKGLFPTMTIYEATDLGRELFDRLQEEAFLGIFPLFLGFKLGLKFNVRRSPAEIGQYAEKAIEIIDATLAGMDAYLVSLPASDPRKKSDAFFIEHDRMLYLEEKRWIQMAVERNSA